MPSIDIQRRFCVDVRDCGAIGDGSTDNYGPFSEASEKAGAGGWVLVPPGDFRTRSPIPLAYRNQRWIGAGVSPANDPKGTRIYNDSGTDIFQVYNSGLHFADMRIESLGSGGHIFEQLAGHSFGVFERLYLTQSNPDYCVWNNADQIYIDNEWRNCNIFGDDEQITPLFNFVRASGVGSCNSNTWRRLRVTCRGTYAFNIESTTTSGQHDNTLEQITFEITNGGAIRILGGDNTTIKNCGVYDLDAPTTAHMIFLGRGSGGASTINTRIENFFRRGGTLGPDMADIYQEGGSNPTNPGLRIENVNNSVASGFTINLNNRNAFLDIAESVTILNPGTSTVRRTHLGEHYGRRYVELEEMSSTPATPSANRLRLFARDNGAGKTELAAIYSSGNVKSVNVDT